jgi:octaprenyl-diphosphate synthase
MDPPRRRAIADAALTSSGFYAILPMPKTVSNPMAQQLAATKKSPVSPLTEIFKKAIQFDGGIDPFGSLAAELDMVEKSLAGSVRSSERLLTEISMYLIASGGKRIRPVIALLAFKLFSGKRIADIVEIATALELIHTATLLHDDIIDDAETRRGKDSAYKHFGLKPTLVAGDFLFIKAFEFAGKFDKTVVQWTADACTHLTEGEMLQGFFNRNPRAAVEDYLEIVRKKTASLFETGAKIGAYMAGAPPAMVAAAAQYGLNLGIAFQITDDVLDVVGHRDLIGKPTGIDLKDGNPSLPIILALREGQQAVTEAFSMESPGDERIHRALRAIAQGNALAEAKALSKVYAERAFEEAKKLPVSLYREGLIALVRLITERDF